MSAQRKTTIETVVAELAPVARDGHSVSAVAATWRFAGIIDPELVRAWLAVGVFDGHRAGMLRVAGITPDRLASVPEGRRLGFDFAIGNVSLGELVQLVNGPPSSRHGDSRAQTTSVRVKQPPGAADD